MKQEIRKITFWKKNHSVFEKRIVKRRWKDTILFRYKGINYILFKNNLQNSYCLTGQCDSINSRNYLLANEIMVQNIKELETEAIAKKILKFIKNRKFGKAEFSEYLKT